MSQGMTVFGLIGYPLGHSFSKSYYDRKMEVERIRDVRYALFPMESISDLPELLASEPELGGLNVTIPHKISVMDYLDELSPEAREIGAVNCIRILHREKDEDAAYFPAHVLAERPRWMIGFNTDAYGFEHSLFPLLTSADQEGRALVLGNGGAAQAVCYVLRKLEIPYARVSRSVNDLTSRQSAFPSYRGEFPPLSYDALNNDVLEGCSLIINTTPLGMAPQEGDAPPIPYEMLGEQHLLFDLIYNPAVTEFLRRGAFAGARVQNGYEMLKLQAERNWEIWTKAIDKNA